MTRSSKRLIITVAAAMTAAGWPEAPASNNEEADWQRVRTYTITRTVEQDGADWKYKIRKVGDEDDWDHEIVLAPQ